jgi:hypothetical protein
MSDEEKPAEEQDASAEADDTGLESIGALVGPPNRARQSERARLKATTLINRRLAKGVHRPFLQSMHRFQGSITTLRRIQEKLTPTVANWPDEIMEEFGAAIKGYPSEQRQALIKFAAEAIPGLVGGTLVFKDQSESTQTNGEGKKEDKVADAWKLVAEQMDDDMGAAYEVLHLLYMKSTTPELAQTFHRSLLVSAVAALDVLLLELIQHFYLVHPGELGKEATFTLKDLSEFSSLNDAKFSATEKKADRVVRKGLEGWQKWLSEKGIDLKTHCADFSNLVEIVQRRHVAVHNDARASRAYLAKIRELTGEESPHQLGEELKIDAAYLERAFDELEAAGNLLVGAVWTKCLAEAEDVVNFELYVRSYDLLMAGRWAATACICSAAKQRLKPDDDLYLIHQVNAWLARKKMGEDVAQEVRDWRTGTLNTKYQAAEAALLDDFDNLAELILKCVRAGDLAPEDAWEWPLFAEIRSQDRWQAIVGAFPREGD